MSLRDLFTGIVVLMLAVAPAWATGMTVTGSIAGIPIDVVTDGSTGGTPTVSSCGTSPTLSAGATDAGFTVTPGTGATGCVITLGGTYSNPVSGVPAAENNTALTWAWSASATTTTYDPTNIGTNVTLSGGNLTESCTGCSGGAWGVARSVASHSSGKYYAEFTLGTGSTAGDTFVALINSSESLNVASSIDANGIANFGNTATFYLNSAAAGTGSTWASVGNVVQVAVDLTNGSIWTAVNGGNWNGSSSNHPNTNTGGVSLSGLAAGPYYAASGTKNGSKWIANFGGSTYSYTPPTGFGNW